MRKKKSVVYLTGGLGNQLFQVAFLLTRDSNIKTAEIFLGSPRKNSNDLPDVLDFNFESAFSIQEVNSGIALTRKVINFFLRNGLGDFPLLRKSLVSGPLRIFGSFLISWTIKKPVLAVVSPDNGFALIPQSKVNEFLIGYFQSYRWLIENESVNMFMRGIILNHEPRYLTDFLNKYAGLNCVAVHVRLGDYLLDPKLGVLNKNYYANALKQVFAQKTYDNIWLFSNEPQAAVEFIPENSRLGS
jgi:hypothetical protein